MKGWLVDILCDPMTRDKHFWGQISTCAWTNMDVKRKQNCCTISAMLATEKTSFLKVWKCHKLSILVIYLKHFFVVWRKLAAMVSNIKFMQIKNYNPILHIFVIYVRRKKEKTCNSEPEQTVFIVLC